MPLVKIGGTEGAAGYGDADEGRQKGVGSRSQPYPPRQATTNYRPELRWRGNLTRMWVEALTDISCRTLTRDGDLGPK